MTDVLGPQCVDFLDGLDVNDPDYIRDLLRPASIKEDVKLMVQRRRVSLILNSPTFRNELEKIVASQMRDGVLSSNVMALKKLVDLLTPHAKLGSSAFAKGATVPVIPINDLHSQNTTYSKLERIIRCKVASTYRLVDIFGWSSGSKGHISAKVFKDGDSYLFNPEGLLFSEITASSLLKVDLKGNIIDGGSHGLGVDKQGWTLHAAVHEALPAIRCVIQLSTPATIAISCMCTDLPPISQEAMMLGAAASYDPASIDQHLQGEERNMAEIAVIGERLQNTAGGDPRILIIRKYGILAMGKSVEEAWMAAYLSVSACEAQLRLACVGMDELVMPVGGEVPSSLDSQALNATTGGMGAATDRSWRPGELEFEAMMRRLDAAGYRTGHLYRVGQVQPTAGTRTSSIPEVPNNIDGKSSCQTQHTRRAATLGRSFRADVEVPPAASSFAANYYKDDATRIKEAAAYRAKTLSLQRMHFSNTPNAYQKEEIEEVGTANPKKITKWTEGSSRTTGGTLLASEDPNQFAPQGDDPREFKENLKKVREMYYKDVRTAGPKSRILEGLGLDDDVDEVDRVDARDGVASSSQIASPRGTLLRLDPANPPTLEPGHVVVVGAVSKGIINREQRHNVGLFQSVFSPNPFDQVTDDELERYKRNVERKAKGLPTEEEEEEMERRKRATLEATAPHSSPQRQTEDIEHECVRSDTSADVGQPSVDGSKSSRKKRRFKMPSFSRKGKDKKKASNSNETPSSPFFLNSSPSANTRTAFSPLLNRSWSKLTLPSLSPRRSR
ncbi:nervous system adducin [Echinococcus multilocularis]|uniref:Nervous system adducin n=1 Tax=Echinococcus multilocularis TaxID=6211 RepID=A0A087W1R4_ECHMU|nr:nervous system adducin [Echinococcus multilocularis]